MQALGGGNTIFVLAHDAIVFLEHGGKWHWPAPNDFTILTHFSLIWSLCEPVSTVLFSLRMTLLTLYA